MPNRRADESQARRAKWRREFKSLGRERVRHLVQVGGISGNQQRCEAAVDWLRDQDKGRRESRTLDARAGHLRRGSRLNESLADARLRAAVGYQA